MRITFLGTSAATSCPLPFCHCKTCTLARQFGGKDFRKRSSILINDDLLIDFGPDVMASSFMHNVEVNKIRYWLQTHSHSDHFDASHIITRIPEYGSVKIPQLNLYASKECLENMTAMLRKEWDGCDLFDSKEREHLNLNIEIVENLHTFIAGSYTITAFSSNHDKLEDSLLYSIQEDDYTVFYGTDTNAFSEDIWNGCHMKGLQFDIIILDHTYGENVGGVDHLNANQFVEHIKRFKREGLLKKNARIFATHISHEGNPTHDGLIEYGRRFGYEKAYDGLIMDLYKK
jgi:phosphoribosyl 1,2-cyclic phosphate phosphodiesterase